ncbi:hypothetical protein B0H14DRAFT_2792856 [Mycena olivaceomarginata]|nr:hypothetical protein B0H14DRAFT_2792856 [Mycena olivaceomarginata]
MLVDNLDTPPDALDAGRVPLRNGRHDREPIRRTIRSRPRLLLSYMQSLVLLSAHRALGHTLTERSSPTQPFSDPQRGARGADAGDLVDGLVEGRVVLEKVRVLEGRMRYQIEKLVRAAQAPESAPGAAVDDPLAFRPNPANLLNHDGEASDVSDNGDEDDGVGDDDGIYQPAAACAGAVHRLHRVRAARRRARRPVPSALRALHDPLLPHAESTSGLGGTPALESARAKHLRRLTSSRRRIWACGARQGCRGSGGHGTRRIWALGAELGSGHRGGGKNRRRGGLEDEFGDVLRSVERGGCKRWGWGWVRRAKEGWAQERCPGEVARECAVRDEPDGDDGARVRKKSRFEQDTKTAKRRLKKSS